MPAQFDIYWYYINGINGKIPLKFNAVYSNKITILIQKNKNINQLI